MLLNQHTAISTNKILLVPYEAAHVITYHQWMKDPEIQETTASEPLSVEEEYEMQQSWRNDHDKLTFIACLPLTPEAMDCITVGAILNEGEYDGPTRMVGDVNLFLSRDEENEGGVTGELELMIAPSSQRRRGLGRSTILTFLHYIHEHNRSITTEFEKKEKLSDMALTQLKVKIGSKNDKSIRLFESIGFLKNSEEPNYFGEFELRLEMTKRFSNEGQTRELMEKWGIVRYNEAQYGKDRY